MNFRTKQNGILMTIIALTVIFVTMLGLFTFLPAINSELSDSLNETFNQDQVDVAQAVSNGAVSAQTAYEFTASNISYNASTKKTVLSVGTTKSTDISWTHNRMSNSTTNPYELLYGSSYAVGGQVTKDTEGDNNEFVGVLNIKVPQFIKDLSSTGTVSNITLSATLYYKSSSASLWGVGWNADFYSAYTTSSSLISYPVDLRNGKKNEDNWNEYFPDSQYTKLYGQSHTSTDGYKNTDISTTITIGANTNYIGFGVAALDNGSAFGEDPPGAYLKNIKITFDYSADIYLSATGGTLDYDLYSNAKYNSLGTADTRETGVTYKKISVTNPFTAIRVYRHEEIGHRLQDYTIKRKNTTVASVTHDPDGTGANDGTGWGQDNPDSVTGEYFMELANLTGRNTSTTSEASLQATQISLTYVPRTIKMIYYENSDGDNNYANDTAYVEEFFTFGSNIVSPINHFVDVTGKISSGWTIVEYNDGSGATTASAGIGENILFIPPIDVVGNCYTFRLVANWVEAGAVSGDAKMIVEGNTSYNKRYSDVTYKVSINNAGYELAGVYAVYEDGDLAIQEGGSTIKIALSEAGQEGNYTYWTLYGICGNCKLYPLWKAKKIKITFSDAKNEIASADKTKYIYYGIGLAIEDMPNITVDAGDNYVF
ncbi:MAG: hypothetical protein IKB56_04120, partial [Clostridia bacterium]|nr:hypothetical protein [Clostridia bacterium]